jgi:hypothetical protein
MTELIRPITSALHPREHLDAITDDSVVTHRFAFDRWYELAGKPFGIEPSRASVTVTSSDLVVTFGWWTVTTPLANVAAATVTGPYAVVKTIGPPHISLSDRGLTFATNRERGVCLRFHRPVRGVDPLGLVRHPGLTVTVEDPIALASLLSSIGDRTVDVRSGASDDTLVELHDDLTALTAAELRRRVRELGVPGTSKMSKADMIELLEETPVPTS